MIRLCIRLKNYPKYDFYPVFKIYGPRVTCTCICHSEQHTRKVHVWVQLVLSNRTTVSNTTLKDDALSLNKLKLTECLHFIYPRELEIKEAT